MGSPGDDSPPDRRLHPLLSTRWSPLTWDAAHTMSRVAVETILEAARWAPSAGNSQPWSFLVGCRGDQTHRSLVGQLAPSARRWAPQASLLVANLSHRHVEGSDMEYSEFALYDLGQAVAHMTVQARALGLQARQFRAFDRAGVAAQFAVPDHWEVSTMTAFGKAAPSPVPRSLTTIDDGPDSRNRRSLSDLDWTATAHPK